MQIIINQADIHTAIRNFIMAQMTLVSDTEIEIELKATRGDEGYTAIIEINPPKPPQGGKQKSSTPAAASGQASSSTANTKTEASKASADVQQPVPAAAGEDAEGLDAVSQLEVYDEVKATEGKITPKTVVKATAPKQPANDAAEPATDVAAEAEAKGPEKTLTFGRKDPAPEASADGPAPRSIFAGMQRPSNSAAAAG